MGAGPCCGFCYMCAGDDAEKDSFIDDYRDDTKKPSKWCVDDSATERVFIPDGTCASIHQSATTAVAMRRRGLSWPANDWFPHVL